MMPLPFFVALSLHACMYLQLQTLCQANDPPKTLTDIMGAEWLTSLTTEQVGWLLTITVMRCQQWLGQSVQHSPNCNAGGLRSAVHVWACCTDRLTALLAVTCL
jgi:hypothetical protein